MNVRVVDVWLADADGERIENVEQGTPIHLNMIVEARQELVHPVFGFHFVNSDGAAVFGFTVSVDRDDDEADVVKAGERVRIGGRIDNPLLPGRYGVSTLISRNRSIGDLALHLIRVLDFVVYGTEMGPGSVSVEHDVEAVVQP